MSAHGEPGKCHHAARQDKVTKVTKVSHKVVKILAPSWSVEKMLSAAFLPDGWCFFIGGNWNVTRLTASHGNVIIWNYLPYRSTWSFEKMLSAASYQMDGCASLLAETEMSAHGEPGKCHHAARQGKVDTNLRNNFWLCSFVFAFCQTNTCTFFIIVAVCHGTFRGK